jgi:hypothetical protein
MGGIGFLGGSGGATGLGAGGGGGGGGGGAAQENSKVMAPQTNANRAIDFLNVGTREIDSNGLAPLIERLR